VKKLGWFKKWLYKKRYYVVFLVKSEDTYDFIKKGQIDIGKDSVRYKGNTYPLNKEKPLYTKFRNVFYFFDVDAGQIYLKGNKNDKNLFKVMDLICSRNVVEQLTTSLIKEETWINKAIWISLGLIIGGLIGYLIGMGGFL